MRSTRRHWGYVQLWGHRLQSHHRRHSPLHPSTSWTLGHRIHLTIHAAQGSRLASRPSETRRPDCRHVDVNICPGRKRRQFRNHHRRDISRSDACGLNTGNIKI